MTPRHLPAIAVLLSVLAPPVPAAPVLLDRIAAVVNDDVITQAELDDRATRLRRQLERQKVAVPDPATFGRQVLDRLILELLQRQLGERTGIRIDDEMLNATVRNLAEQNRMSLADFRLAIERDGMPFDRFREEVRRELLIGRVQQAQVHNRVTVTEPEIDSQLGQARETDDRNREYRLAHILIGVPDGATPAEFAAAEKRAADVLARLRAGADFRQTAVAVSQGQQALEGGDLGWRRLAQLPQLFADAVVELQPGAISPLLKGANGLHILKLLETRGEARHVVDQAHARHILIRVDEVIGEAEARRRLELLRERILLGEDFAALARVHSDDKGTAGNGGDLGWSNPGQFVAPFEEALKKLRPDELSSPVRTQFGWHLIQLLGRREHDNTEEFRRARTAEQIRRRKGEEELGLWLRRLRDEAWIEIRLES